ncbi:MAG: aldo/keto reductase [Candidatus Aminicenantes bacterium]|nr:aldo/keto reductase [Candidatus Aminicenantes bacterium]
MEYRHLGRSGLKVSALSFGTWVTFGEQIDEAGGAACLKAAYDAGVNFFDTAEGYAGGRAETMLGVLIRRFGWKRSDLVVSTKIFWGGGGPNDTGLSRKHILEGTEASLRRLQMDYVDLLFCHRPDRETPIEETVRAMSHLVDRGKAHYWGTSEWNAEQIRTAYEIARREHLVPPTMEQPQYNMFVREFVEKELSPLYDDYGLGTTTWSPLNSGFLSGKYLKGIPEGCRLTLRGYGWLKKRFEGPEAVAKTAKVRKLARIAGELGVPMSQLAIAWCLKNPRVSSVITGASRAEQVVENMKALDVVPLLTGEVMARIEKILANAPVPETNFR